MQTKLTLRLDTELIAAAKVYAQKSEKSVSQLVAEYFSVITRESQPATRSGKRTQRLRGLLRDTLLDESDFRTHSEAKHQ